MLLTLALPRINEHMTTARIEAVHASEGAQLTVGSKLFDLCLDLTAIAPQDCPAISYYRIALRDRAWLRKLFCAPGDVVAAGAVVAQLSTEPDEPLDGAAARSARITLAGIVRPDNWLDAVAP